MRFLAPYVMIIMLGMVMVGCSGGTNTPVNPPSDGTAITDSTPSLPEQIPSVAETPQLLEPSEDAIASANVDGSNILYAGILELDEKTQTIKSSIDREPMYNFNITGYLMSGGCTGGCLRYKIISVVNHVWTIDVTLENPTYIFVYDVRLIFTILGGKTIDNPDGYTNLYDPAGGLPFNPFIAFATESVLREFPTGHGKDTQQVILTWPQGASGSLKYIVIASLPLNTREPYTLDSFVQTGNLDYAGTGQSSLAVHCDDWQWNISEVRADTRTFNNLIPYLVNNPEQPEKFECIISNTNHAYPGTYPTLFWAMSENAQNAVMYNIFNVVVTGPPQHPPVCDFYINPDFIYVGQTTTLYPGPGISDPDGNNIVLYEFDFYYNDGVFNTMASNTTGAPVVTPPAPYLGPNNVTVTMALRITDNGAPPMSSICTDKVTISPNQAPVCDLKVVPTEIASGQTVQLSPGPNCKDPDGSIVLYEYDKDYNGVTFDVDYSNTTGAPVTAGPYSNPGPGPKVFTIGMRVTDNGSPALKSTCTKQITVVLNQSPICDLALSDYEINSGASVNCYPGPGTIDPDGAIVLYEYDFNYNLTTFNVSASNTTGAPVATGPIDNTGPDPVTRHIAMRVTDNGTPAVKVICTKDLVIKPILIGNNPWRNPAVRVTPPGLDWASVDRDHMENNVVVYGNNVYVVYYGSISGVQNFYIQRSTNGGVTFNTPQNFNYPVNCWVNNMDICAMDVLANGWVAVAMACFHDNCIERPDGEMRFVVCKPNGSGGVDIQPYVRLYRCIGSRLYTEDGEGVQSIDVAAHPTDPNICFVDAIDLDAAGSYEWPDDTMLWKVSDITTSPSATEEFTVVPSCAGAEAGSGNDKAHMDAVCDYNGNLHVVWCCRDLGTIYYSMVYGNTSYPFQFTPYTRVNLFGEQYPEGAHIAIDHNNQVYIAYAATGIPGEVEPQEIGMLSGVGYPPTFPNAPIILNHDRTGNQVYPDIEFDQTTGDLWVAYTTFAYGPGQITFELYDYEDGWTQFQPNYWINKDDPSDTHKDQNVHLFFVSSTGTAYAIWEETDGPNAPHIYFNRTH